MEFRKIKLEDEKAYREFEAAMLEDKKSNPFVEWWHIEDFQSFVSKEEKSEVKAKGQSWSIYTRYFAFLDGKIVGNVICYWELGHPDCQKLGHMGYMVAPSFRRQGFASRFVSFALKRYREKGMDSILIATDQTNLASRRLIEKMGGQLVALEEVEYQEQLLQSARYKLKLKHFMSDTSQSLNKQRI